MHNDPHPTFPPIAPWRIHCIRLLFALMACFMGYFVWYNLLFASADVPVPQGLSRSMLGALALLSLLGVRYPIQMLPLMLYEVTWKTVWLLVIALRAWLAGKWTPDMQSLFEDCIGIVLAYIFMPWRYVWARYIVQPMEPFRPRS
ncbi:MAG: hypothetical protein IE933_08290 [Sphingomonadales bacterium]|nr:hypothetical protein [Sphingomonadales bacterium]MBD3773976.1 hypothetical protein [Paracoccaceae bacterium]